MSSQAAQTAGKVELWGRTVLAEMALERHMDSQELANRLARERSNRGWSQEDAARALDVSLRTYVNWENAETTPYLKNLNRISEVFEIPIEEMAGPEAPSLRARLDRMEAALERIEQRLGPIPAGLPLTGGDPAVETSADDRQQTPASKSNRKASAGGRRQRQTTP